MKVCVKCGMVGVREFRVGNNVIALCDADYMKIRVAVGEIRREFDGMRDKLIGFAVKEYLRVK